MQPLYDRMLAWCEDYLPPADAFDLARAVTHEAKKTARAQLASGILIGFLGALILIKWLS